LPIAIGRIAFSTRLLLNFYPTLAQVDLEGRPLTSGIVDRLAQQTLGHEASNRFEAIQPPPDPLHNGAALVGRTASRKAGSAFLSRNTDSM